MRVIGIDLGTTNSACGVWMADGVKLIPNSLGEFLTPSVVGVDAEGKVIVGQSAKERLLYHPDKTIAAFKRWMGSDYSIKLKDQNFTAIELSSLILRALKADAEAFLGETVSEAVISVPAYFNDNQRLATKQAAELAGLKVQRLINEPTAAAMAYGLHEKNDGTFLILDLGGGTFDVSLLEFFDGIMEVHASAGDNYLGGEDFVNAMIETVLNEHGVKREELVDNQLQQLYRQMEMAKRALGTQEQTLELELGSKSVEQKITLDWFARLATPLLVRIKQPIERALRDSKTERSAIDDVLLVGGSTRLAAFRSTIAKMFGRFPAANLDPDTVVASGAAIQAGLIMRDEALEDVVLTDVCPYTLGTGVVNEASPDQGNLFMPIIERNTTVPVSISRKVYNAYDNQDQLRIRVYQGEHRLVRKNVLLGELLVDVTPLPEGQEVVEIRYSYDMNGLLEVDATVQSTGKTYNKIIEHVPGTLTEETKQASLERLAKLKFHPREGEENRTLLARGERLYESSLGTRREYIAELMAYFEKALESQNAIEIAQARQQISRALDEIEGESLF